MEPNKTIKSAKGNTLKLYHGDCYEVLPHVGPIDAVVTDPPYLHPHMGSGGCFAESNKKVVGSNEKLLAICDSFDMPAAVKQWFDLGAKTVVSFCSNQQVADLYAALKDVYHSVTILVWHKHNACPLVNNTWMPDIEYIIHAKVKGGFMNNEVPTAYKSKVKRYPLVTERSWHPTPKPLGLLRELMTVTIDPLARVCDPFMGSGSTALACIKQQHDFVGVEKDDTYFGMAANEILLEADQRKMF